MKLTILNSSAQFDGLQATLQAIFEQTRARLEDMFDLSVLDVTISPFDKGEAPASGIGGWAFNAYRIEIQLDCQRPDVLDVIHNEFAAVLAHEVNHIERLKRGMPDKTLAQNLVYEGLACHFERAFNGEQLPSLFAEIQLHDWRVLLHQMRDELAIESFNFNAIFLGGGAPSEVSGEMHTTYPKYAGYWVGYNLVREYALRYGLTDKEMLGLPDRVFFLNLY